MRRPAAVLFDFHDTLVHLAPSTDEAMARTFGVPVQSYRRAWTSVDAHLSSLKAAGNLPLSDADRWIRLYARLLDELGLDADPVEVARRFTALYRSPADYGAFPDAAPVLRRLAGAGIRMGVISNSDFDLWPIIRRVGLEGMIEVAVPVLAYGTQKPDAAAFALALDRMGVAAGDCWYAGDHLEDDATASHALGMRAVLVDRAGRYRAHRPAPFPILADLSPLPGLIGLDDRPPGRGPRPSTA